MHEPSHQPVRHIDYAPPPRGPAWLTWRRVMLCLLIITAGISAWIVVPRVWQRGELLRLQRSIAQEAADQPVRMGRSPDGSWFATSRISRKYSEHAFGDQSRTAGWATAYAGSVRSGPDAPPRLLFVDLHWAVPHQEKELYLRWAVIAPATWTSRAQHLAGGGAFFSQPFDPGQAFVVRRGSVDAEQGRVELLLEAVTDPEMAASSADEVQEPFKIVVHLMADDTVRVDWHAAVSPVAGPQ